MKIKSVFCAITCFQEDNNFSSFHKPLKQFPLFFFKRFGYMLVSQLFISEKAVLMNGFLGRHFEKVSKKNAKINKPVSRPHLNFICEVKKSSFCFIAYLLIG